jgi:hypothetical protein
MIKRLTVDGVMDLDPCGLDEEDNGSNYTRRRVAELFGGRESITLRDVLRTNLIPARDILWLAIRGGLISDKNLRLLACIFAERSLLQDRRKGREPDKRSWAAVEAGRDYAFGKISVEKLRTAFADAEDAEWDAEKAASPAAVVYAARAARWAVREEPSGFVAAACAVKAAWDPPVASAVAWLELKWRSAQTVWEYERRNQLNIMQFCIDILEEN